MSDSLWLHGLQHARLPCPSPSPRACSNSCPLSQWCHPIISSSFTPFSSCLQSLPASGSFLISRLFASGGQSIGASAWVLPVNIQGWFPLGLTGLILLSRGRSRVVPNTTVQKHQFSYMSLKWSEVKSLSHVRLFATPWTVAYQAPSSIHGIFQARVLEWIAISFSRGSSWPRNQTRVSHTAGRRFIVWATRVQSSLFLFPLLMSLEPYFISLSFKHQSCSILELLYLVPST